MVFTQTLISNHVIKPSVLTPDNLKTHRLSYLDQLSTPMYISPIFFYENNESKSNIEKSQLLKQSLSQALTVFHPFSGTIRENSFVDCDDMGVEFVEAQVHTRLARIIEEPQMEDLKQLVPVDSLSHSDSAILLVKASFFDCGGMAIGVCLSHKVADHSSTIVFIDAWASICRGETPVIQPLFDLAVHFPPRESTLSNFLPDNENNKTKRFVFDKEKLKRLQQETSSMEVKNPSRVEALTVFLLQNFIQATKATSGKSKTSSFLVHHAMNLRTRANPPIPDQTIGNCISSFHAVTSDTMDTSDLISRLRVAKDSVNDSFIKEVINTEEYLRTIDELTEIVKSGSESLIFTSLWRYPVYDIDFGWGKPIWVSDATVASKNTITFTSTPSKDGIEAWVNMSDDFLQMLEINYNKHFN